MERRGRGPSTKRAASAASAAAAREPEPRRRSPASPTWQRQKRKPSDGIFVFMAVFFFSLFFLARGLLFFLRNLKIYFYFTEFYDGQRNFPVKNREISIRFYFRNSLCPNYCPWNAHHSVDWLSILNVHFCSSRVTQRFVPKKKSRESCLPSSKARNATCFRPSFFCFDTANRWRNTRTKTMSTSTTSLWSFSPPKNRNTKRPKKLIVSLWLGAPAGKRRPEWRDF